jgi:beta-glucosidase
MRTAFLFFCLLFITSLFAQQPKYKNANLPIDQRVEDLIVRMTLEEKVAQLISYFSRDTSAFDENGNFIGVQDTAVLNHGVGSFSSWSLWRMPSPQKTSAVYE